MIVKIVQGLVVLLALSVTTYFFVREISNLNNNKND